MCIIEFYTIRGGAALRGAVGRAGERERERGGVRDRPSAVGARTCGPCHLSRSRRNISRRRRPTPPTPRPTPRPTRRPTPRLPRHGRLLPAAPARDPAAHLRERIICLPPRAQSPSPLTAQLSDHADFYALCLVSRRFHGTALRFLYRRVVVPHRPCHSREAFAAPLAALFTPAQQRDFATGRRPARPQPYSELSDCGEFVRHFRFDQRNLRAVVGGGGELVEAAIENMSRLESFV